MPRAVTAATQAELSKIISRIGYLMAFSTSPPLRWCNVGAVNWNSMVFVEYDFEVNGVGGSAEGQQDAQVVVQNLDNAIAAVFMTADASAITCDIYQVAPAAVAVADVVRVGRYLLGDTEIGLDRMSLRLVPENSLDAFSPRRRVDPSNGFNHALPEGSKIAWESEIYIVESARG